MKLGREREKKGLREIPGLIFFFDQPYHSQDEMDPNRERDHVLSMHKFELVMVQMLILAISFWNKNPIRRKERERRKERREKKGEKRKKIHLQKHQED